MVRTLEAFYEAGFSISVFYLGTFSVSLFGDCFSQIFGHLILSKGGIFVWKRYLSFTSGCCRCESFGLFNIKSTFLNCLECGSLKRGELDFVLRVICFRFYQEI